MERLQPHIIRTAPMNSSAMNSAPESETIPLRIITAREPVSTSPWVDERWWVVGAVAGAAPNEGCAREILRAGPDGERYLWTGVQLRLIRSEVDAYYFNLMGSNPSLYVFCERDADGGLAPTAATLEYSEAMAHDEFGNEVFAVPIPAELYRRIERFVVAHYVPEEPKSRRKPGEPASSGGRTGGQCG